MKKLFLLLAMLTTGVLPGVGQRIMVTGGYLHLGEPSFRGVPTVGLNVLFPVGQHLALGLLTTAGRARQDYPLYIGNWGMGHTVDVLHNHFLAADALVGYRLGPTERLGLVLGPTLGLAGVGRREQPTSAKLSVGLVANVTYRKILGGRFNLEAVVHPRLLFVGPAEDDGNSTFADIGLRAWEVQAGISYGLWK